MSTLLVEPGYLVLTGPHGEASAFPDVDVAEWLRVELEEGSRGQPASVADARWR